MMGLYSRTFPNKIGHGTTLERSCRSRRRVTPERPRHVVVERGVDVHRQRAAVASPARGRRLRQEQPHDRPLEPRRLLPPCRELDAKVAHHVVLVDAGGRVAKDQVPALKYNRDWA